MSTSVLQEIADRFFANHEFNSAIKYYKQITDLDSKNSLAHEGIALCKYAQLEIDDSFKHFSLAIEFDENSHNAYFYRSSLYFEKGEYQKALGDVNAAIGIYGESIDYWSLRVKINSLVKNFDEVILDCKLLLEVNSDDLYAIENMAYAYAVMEKHEEAIEHFKKVISLQPGIANDYNNLGYSLSKLKKYELAIKYFDAAINFDPDFAYPYDNRGLCKFYLGDMDGALKDINISLEMDLSNSYGYKNRAKVKIAKEDYGAAKKDLELALELGYSEKYDNEVELLLKDLKERN